MKKSQIIQNIKEHQETPVSADWLSNGQKNLQSFMSENPVRNYYLDRHNKQERIFKKLTLKPMPIAIIAVIFSLLAGSGVVTASQNSLPTDRLYPLKLISEKVEEVATFRDAKKVELQTKLADKRLAEINDLQDQGQATKVVVEENLQRYQNNLTKAQEYLEKLSASDDSSKPKIVVASLGLEKAINNQRAVMANLEEKAPAEYKSSLTSGREIALSNYTQSLDKIRVKINQEPSNIKDDDDQDEIEGYRILRDQSGCLPGSFWCGAAQKCLKTGEEQCDDEKIIKEKNAVINIKSNELENKKNISVSTSTSPGQKEIILGQIDENIISEENALKIAAEAGLEKGIEAWKTELYKYYGKIDNYVWAVSNRLTKFSGQTVIINAESGKIYEIIDYKIAINPPIPGNPQPITCPKYIDCMPRIIEEGAGVINNCQIPVGCEKITEIVY